MATMSMDGGVLGVAAISVDEWACLWRGHNISGWLVRSWCGHDINGWMDSVGMWPQYQWMDGRCRHVAMPVDW